ncbi:SIR2 family protein [Lactococcus garvieae]|uniref:SIR2 family protein n=1 Tax=Lactococcus garvieae TaxID=1363 RepID=UPI0030D4913E
MTEMKSLYHFQGKKNTLADIKKIDEQKLSISSFVKQAIKTSNLVIFYGSGCSVEAIPMMSQTMKKILQNVDNTDVKEMFVTYQSKTRASDGDIEGFLNWLQNGIAFESDLTKQQTLETVFEKVQKEFIETIPKYNDENYFSSSCVETYSKFYQKIFEYRTPESDKLSIFTPNYDLFTEYALEYNNISYTTGFTTDLTNKFDINQFKYRLVDDTNRYKDKWQPVKKEANLYKMHGSINWVQDIEGQLYQRNYKILEKERVVIYPTQLKHQETAQTPYSELFREFSNCLQKPNTTLLVMGYGFPDEHINTIISQNLQNSDFNLIVFGDKDEEKMKQFQDKNGKNNFHLIGGDINGEKGHYFNVIVDEYLESQVENKDGE